jgi:hypothetical protein
MFVASPIQTPRRRVLAAILAPYLSGLFYRQSDFGDPAVAVVGDMIVSDFRCFGLPPKSGLWRGSQLLHADAAAVVGVFAGNRD